MIEINTVCSNIEVVGFELIIVLSVDLVVLFHTIT